VRNSFRFLISILIPGLALTIGSFAPVLDARAAEAAPAAGTETSAATDSSSSSGGASAVTKEKASDGFEVQVSLGSGGLKLQTKDGRFKFQLGGRVHVDGTYHLGDTPGDVATGNPAPADFQNVDPTDGAEIRRARLGAKATVWDVWNWVGEVDFADNETTIKDFSLSYTGFENTAITVGNQKQPYSLSLEMSSNDIPFVERSVDNGQNDNVDRAIGLRVDTNGDHWFAAAGIFGDTAAPQKTPGDEGWGVAGRVVYAPIIEDREVVHLGFRTAFRRPAEEDKTLRIRDETTHMSNYRVVDTGEQDNIDSLVLFGPEAAISVGPLWVFGEYSRAHIRRNGFDTAEFDSGHIAAAWTLTGESRATTYSIKSGEFKGIKPTHNFSLSKGGAGAWEIAIRYAYLNLNDGGSSNPGAIQGGEEQTLSTALNWYVNPNVRFMLNWNHIIETDISDSPTIPAARRASTKEAQGMDIFTLRAQFNF
jgi:phosphate-selective porin OprO/OprP